MERVIIMRYEIPVIGRYEIDEGMDCLLNGKVFGKATDIDAAKEKIRSSVADTMKVKVVELQSQIGQLNSINVGLIDEKYRVKPYKN